MIRLDISEEGDKRYGELCDFANAVYFERLGVELSSFPKHILYAEDNSNILGTLGLTPGDKKNPLLIETYFDFNLLDFLSGGKESDRRVFGEVGTLSVAKNAKIHITLVLTAGLIVWSRTRGFKFLALTTTKVIQRMYKPLRVDVLNIGSPDFSKKDEEFKKKWERYFSLKPDSVGINVEQASIGCLQKMVDLGSEIDFQRLLAV